ncbi:hypothetical protein [Paraburkholderia ultramafica]|uniref:hypothetical protein n=1 Tax=Paraburkholderia ultramafica TaxID=1544867 RepID=UPI001C2E7C19|nr:hypothetical protein [Paraburkholderia ultramafica]
MGSSILTTSPAWGAFFSMSDELRGRCGTAISADQRAIVLAFLLLSTVFVHKPVLRVFGWVDSQLNTGDADATCLADADPSRACAQSRLSKLKPGTDIRQRKAIDRSWPGAALRQYPPSFRQRRPSPQSKANARWSVLLAKAGFRQGLLWRG